MKRLLLSVSTCALCAGLLLISGCAASQGARYARHLDATVAEAPRRDADIAAAFGLDEFAPASHAAARPANPARVTAAVGP